MQRGILAEGDGILIAEGCKGCSTSFSKDDSREKAQVHLKKLQGQHKKAATEAVLAAQKLNSEDHQKLLGKPANLIILLYQHSSIAERFQNPTGRDYPGELKTSASWQERPARGVEQT